jgi:DNA-binding transcriptional regulator YhcF (GntR family)
MQNWTIVAQGTVPIGLQLKEQIRWEIATGKRKPGDPLPSVRDLAESLGIARQTINAVYDELRGDGLIQMGRGRGTEVADTDAVRGLSRLVTLLGLLDDAMDRALQEGFAVKEVTQAAMVRAQLLEAQALQQQSLTLVVDPGNEAEWFAGQVRAITGGAVRMVTPAQLRENPALAGARVVTTCLESGTVRELLPPETEVIFLGVVLPLRNVLELRDRPAGGTVLLVGRSREAAAWLADGYNRSDLSIKVEAAGIADDDLEGRCREAVAIWATPGAFQALIASAALDKVTRLDLALEAGSVEALKRCAERARA